jgi:hypothetical protein
MTQNEQFCNIGMERVIELCIGISMCLSVLYTEVRTNSFWCIFIDAEHMRALGVFRAGTGREAGMW